MKPWEETWTADANGAVFVGPPDERMTILESPASAPERARLAAAAPDMARVLLEVEWSWRDGSACPVCNEYAPGETTEGRGGHAPDCALDAALRKAGVR